MLAVSRNCLRYESATFKNEGFEFIFLQLGGVGGLSA